MFNFIEIDSRPFFSVHLKFGLSYMLDNVDACNAVLLVSGFILYAAVFYTFIKPVQLLGGFGGHISILCDCNFNFYFVMETYLVTTFEQCIFFVLSPIYLLAYHSGTQCSDGPLVGPH